MTLIPETWNLHCYKSYLELENIIKMLNPDSEIKHAIFLESFILNHR